MMISGGGRRAVDKKNIVVAVLTTQKVLFSRPGMVAVVYICTVSVWLTGRRARRSSGFDVGVGGGVGGDRGSFQAVIGKESRSVFSKS